MELRISKLDAARRELETAVRLYFAEADPISIHTLAAAAHQVLVDLNRKRGGPPSFTEAGLQLVRPERRKEALKRLNEAANFFKHADSDPQGVLHFKAALTEMLLFDACNKLRELGGEVIPALETYRAWFWLGPGADLVDVSADGTIDRFRASFTGATRGAFFRDVLPMIAEFHA
jgi:hypothetical protein